MNDSLALLGHANVLRLCQKNDYVAIQRAVNSEPGDHK